MYSINYLHGKNTPYVWKGIYIQNVNMITVALNAPIITNLSVCLEANLTNSVDPDLEPPFAPILYLIYMQQMTIANKIFRCILVPVLRISFPTANIMVDSFHVG